MGLDARKIRSKPYSLDAEKVHEVYNLGDFTPIQYEIPYRSVDSLDAKLPAFEGGNSFVLCIGDFQAGALRTAEGYNPTPIKQLELYIEGIKAQLLEKFVYKDVSGLDLFVLSLGDIVDGEHIYIGQDVIPVWQQLQETVRIIYDLLQFLEAFGFRNIFYHGVAGNHGRQPSPFVDEGTNWDTQVSYTLKQIYDTHKKHIPDLNVHINYTIDRFQKVEIDGYNFMIHHGDFLKGGLKIEKIEEAINMWKLDHFDDADAWVIGHWHSTRFGKTFNTQYLVNGSLYSSPYEALKLRKKGNLAFVLFRTGERQAISDIHILDVEHCKMEKGHFTPTKYQKV